MELLHKERKKEQGKRKECTKSQSMQEAQIVKKQITPKDMPKVPMALPINKLESWNKQDTKEKVVKNFGGTRMKNKVFLLVSMFIMSLVAMCTCAYAADAPDVFITEWTVPASTTIKLPIPTNTVNNYTVDYGDGTVQSYTTEDFPSHTYASAGTYTIKINGRLFKFGYNDNTNVPAPGNTYSDYYTFTQYITKLVQWGELDAWQYGFSNCINLAGNIPEPTENSFKDFTNFNGTFANCKALTGSIPANLFANCPNVIDFRGTFYGCTGLTGSIPPELFANCPKAATFTTMFQYCEGLTGTIPPNLFANCPEVTDFQWVFAGCKGLTGSIPAELFASCSKVTNFNGVFSECSGLTGSIPANLFANCPEVIYFRHIFFECSGLEGDIPAELFAGCPKAADFQWAFSGCKGLTGSIPAELFANCSKVTSFGGVFANSNGLTGNIPANLFANCPNVTSFSRTFSSCKGLTDSIPGELFANCQKVTNFSYTFAYCDNLTGSIPAELFANSPEATDFNSLFVYCSKLTGTIPTELFANCPKANNFYNTFYWCTGLTGNVPVELFANNTAITVPENTDASNASLASTFYHCTGLTGVNMNTPYIGYQMFYGCNNLTDITIGNNVQAIATEAFKATSPYSAENPLTTTLKTNNSVAQNYDWTGVNRGATIQNIEEEHPWYDEGVLDLVAPSITDVQATLTSEGIKVTATIADPVLPDGTAGSGINTSKTRYMLTETSTKPSAEPGDAERAWQESAILSFDTSLRTFYVWVKAEDNVGNVTISDGTFVDLLAYAESVTIPTIEGSYVYDGTEQTVTLANFDSSKMRVTNNTRTNAGTQEVEVSLINTTDYKWADNTIEPKKLSWTIAKKAATLTCNDARVGATLTKDIPYTYDGDGTLNVVSSDSSIVSVVSVNETNNTITIRGEAQGTATLTLSATGSNYADVSSTISVLVFNESYGECILDTEGPEITNVASSKTGNSLTVSATITDPNLPDGTKGSGVDLTSIRYMITDTSEKPASDNANWSEDPVFSVEHFRNNVYVWVKAKDNLGNETISDATLGMISVRINLGDTKEVPYIYSGTGTVVATPQTGGIVTITGIDQSNKIISIKADAVGKVAIDVTADGNALTTIYAVVYKDSCGGCILDTVGPAITNVTGSKTTESVTISAMITDPNLPDGTKGSGVDTTSIRYMMTQENTKPASDDTGWSTSNILPIAGLRNIAYMWIKAKDNLGNETISSGHTIQLAKSIVGFTAEVTGTYTYTGSPIIPPDANISLKDGDKVLVKGTDYEVTFKDNINSGVATATFEGKGEYYGTIEKTFAILKADRVVTLSNEHTMFIKETNTLEFTYTGENSTSQVTVSDASVITTTLVEKENGGTITIKALKKGTATITVTIASTENYNAATATCNVTVNKLVQRVTSSGYNGVYDTKPHTITVTIEEGATCRYGMLEGNYTLTEKPTFVNAGTYTVYYEVEKEDYETVYGSEQVVITPKEIAVEWSNTSIAYDGEEHVPTAKVETGFEEEKITHRVTGAKKDIGTGYVAQFVATGVIGGNENLANYNIQNTTTTFEITVCKTGGEINLNEYQYVYDGTEKKPKVTFVTTEGKLLVEGVDFTVEYRDNIHVGTATVVVTGIGNYEITESKTFVIEKATPVLQLQDKLAIYTGSEIAIGEVEISGIRAELVAEMMANGAIEYHYYTDPNSDVEMDRLPVEPGVYYVEATYTGAADYNQAKSNQAILKIYGAPTAPKVIGRNEDGHYESGSRVSEAVNVVIYGSEVEFNPRAEFGYQYSLDGTTWIEYKAAITVNTEGKTTIYARAFLKENAALVSNVTTYEITIDKTAPVIDDVVTPEITDTVVIPVDISGDDIDQVIITEDETFDPTREPDNPSGDDMDPNVGNNDWKKPDENGETVFELSQGDGEKEIYVWAKDKVGNITGPVKKVIRLSALKIGNENKNETTLSFKVSDLYLHKASITAEDIVLYVAGKRSTGRAKSVTVEEISTSPDTEKAYKFTIIIENVTGDGDLAIGIRGNEVYDKAGNLLKDWNLVQNPSETPSLAPGETVDNEIVRIATNEITVDNTMPELTVDVEGKLAHIIAKDEHFRALMVNGETISKVSGEWNVNLKAGQNTIVALDEYGNETAQKVTLNEETLEIESVANEPIKLSHMKALYYLDGVEREATEFDRTMYRYVSNAASGEENVEARWANARTEDGTDYVWIPRFAYKVTYYEDMAKTKVTTNVTAYRDVHVIFLKGNTDTYQSEFGEIYPLPDGYQVAKAFTRGNGGWNYELNGFWIAKYESDSGKNVSEAHEAARILNPEAKSHLAKNSEWEATLLLAESKYGRNGNFMEVDVALEKGGPLPTSTTGNITGVFDMLGGLWEYTSTYIENGSTMEYAAALVAETNQAYKEVFTEEDIANVFLANEEMTYFSETMLENPYKTSLVIYRGGDKDCLNLEEPKSVPVEGSVDERFGYRTSLVCQ